MVPKYQRQHPQRLHLGHTGFIKLSKNHALCNGITPLSCLICHPLKTNTDSALQHSCLAYYFLFYTCTSDFSFPAVAFTLNWMLSYSFQTLILIYPEHFKVWSCPVFKTFITPFSWVSSTIFISIFKFIMQIIKEILKRTGTWQSPWESWLPPLGLSSHWKPNLCCSLSTTAEGTLYRDLIQSTSLVYTVQCQVK